MRQRNLSLFCALMLFLLRGRANAQDNPGEEVTIRGEVIDPACYLRAEQKGAAHKQCTIACAKAGHDLAIYDPNTDVIYFIVQDKPGTDPNLSIRAFAAETVEVQGTLYSRSGMKGTVVKTVKPLP